MLVSMKHKLCKWMSIAGATFSVMSCGVDADPDKPIEQKLIKKMIPIVYSPKYKISVFGMERLHPFDIAKYDKIYARAARPKVDQGVLGTEDWRETIVEYKGKQMTALMRFWLRQKNVFPLTDFEAGASNDRFVIIPNEDL